jgi:hypothetical protein
MLKQEKVSELKFDGSKEFDDSRKECVEGFVHGISMFKRKITQGLFWTAIDKDLANQYMRDERWLCGIKFWDAMKVIDHGTKSNKETGLGFRADKNN